ncbi:hypothetical protein HRW18_16740 [Streptomyces lunaelactis]|nr:hypothetical protein [Streptomyces lunaelactis]NUK09623.1 hypothetical protein [Streptomyces lunaelactis]NUL13817.1 hypothetical protein [Streptomyces lunaelactis]NUL23663.1 hypothetical protein [Streptomyces lunaelactis]
MPGSLSGGPGRRSGSARVRIVDRLPELHQLGGDLVYERLPTSEKLHDGV